MLESAYEDALQLLATYWTVQYPLPMDDLTMPNSKKYIGISASHVGD